MGAAHVAMYTGCRNSKVLIRMVEDFVWRAKGSGEGVSWDFTKADGLFAGFFCGDSHFNMHEVDRNVNYFVTQSMSCCSIENLMPGTRRADINLDESLCCDVIAVKPAKNEVHTFRIGAGGADFDYEFTY